MKSLNQVSKPVRLVLYLLLAMPPASLLCQPANAASHYDAVKDFSVKSNPNGVWTYLDSAPLAYASRKYEAVSGLDNWSDDIGYPNGASIIVNKTGAPITLDGGTTAIPPGYVVLDAEVYRPGVVLQFQAPVAGSYTFSCELVGLNTNEAPHVTLFLGLNGSFGNGSYKVKATTHRHFKKTITLAAGDTFSFLSVGDPHPGQDYLGLSVKVTGP